MRDVFDRKWFIVTISTWLVVFALDELTYWAWRKGHPGSNYTGVFLKHPLTSNPQGQVPGTSVPNGYKPGGSGYVVG